VKNANATSWPLAPLSTAIRLALGSFALAGAVSIAGVAAAQTTSNTPSSDESLTWHGITLYGIVDIGLQYDTHGAPISDYFSGGSNDIVQSDSNRSVFGVTPSNMSQSRVGLQGVEKIPDLGDWTAVFKLETFFNPQSGNLTDGLKSITLQNGRALANRSVGIDSSVAGQIFQQSYAGFSSPTFGTITFGRQNTLLADGVSKYDPNYASQAFSVIGLSGTTAGGGDTENRRLDNSIKYVASFDQMVHVGALYKFNQSTGGGNNAYQADLGFEFAGASVDAYYSKVYDAVAAGVESAAQVAELPTLAQPVTAPAVPVPGSLGVTAANSVTGTISDNTTFGVMGLYNMGAPKFFAGYEHIKYVNPSDPLSPGYTTIGGYKLAFVSNTAFPNAKILQVYWAGAKYTVIPELDLTVAYYGYHQNSYGAGAEAGCNTSKAAVCSGTLDGISFDADYRLTKRFDAYAGLMYTVVYDGLASGYLNRINIDPTIGIRYKF
jgi:predicted porin